MSGDDRRPELDSDPRLSWQRVGMKNIFKLEIDQKFKLEMHPLRHNKHGTPWQGFQSGMCFSKGKVKLGKEQK